MKLPNFFGGKDEDIVISASGNTLEEALQNMNTIAASQDLVHNGQETEYYCGICGKMMPISHLPH